jgi:hypothetical protein
MPVSVHSMFGSPTSEVPTAQDTSADVTEPSDDNFIEPFWGEFRLPHSTVTKIV